MVTGQNILLLLICYYGKFQLLLFLFLIICVQIVVVSPDNCDLNLNSRICTQRLKLLESQQTHLKFWKKIVFRSTIELYIFPCIKLIRHNFLETNVLNSEHPTLLWKFRIRNLILPSWIWQCNRWVATIWKVDSMSHINMTYYNFFTMIPATLLKLLKLFLKISK